MLKALLLLTIGIDPAMQACQLRARLPLFFPPLASLGLQHADHPRSHPNGSYLTEGIMGSTSEGC